MTSVAVVGAGISGIAAAHHLQDAFDVTLFEAADRIGGHAYPVAVTEGDRQFWVDVGFMIFNANAYPHYIRFLEDIGAYHDIHPTKMSFFIADAAEGFYFSTRSWRTVVYPRHSRDKLGYYRMLLDIRRFRAKANADIAAGRVIEASLGDYLADFGDTFKDGFIYPMGSLIWSIEREQVQRYPAQSFIQYFHHHGNLRGGLRRPWLSFKHSSKQYLDAFAAKFAGTIRVSTPIRSIQPDADRVEVALASGETEVFDRVIVALPAHKAWQVLGAPTPLQRKLLEPWRYTDTEGVLHTDTSVLPLDPETWGCWNVNTVGGKHRITYNLSLAQDLDGERHYLFTMNDPSVREDAVLKRVQFQHPIFDGPTLALQRELPTLNDGGPIGFCGSYFGYGFHEDGVRSALDVVASIKS